MRTSVIQRKTEETDINLTLTLEGRGIGNIDTGVGFLNHMLTLFAVHGRFDIDIVCRGDIEVDDHHSTEDIGIALGEAFKEALGNKQGIVRYGDVALPMDEALCLAAADISGRGYLGYKLDIPTEKVGTFDTELVEEFFVAFTRSSGICLHLRQLEGRNSHHIIEAAFKASARCLRQAVAIDEGFEDFIPSTKGLL